jgi:hypothetical protein
LIHHLEQCYVIGCSCQTRKKKNSICFWKLNDIICLLRNIPSWSNDNL